MGRCAAATNGTAAPWNNVSSIPAFSQVLINASWPDIAPRTLPSRPHLLLSRNTNHHHLFALNQAAIPVDIEQWVMTSLALFRSSRVSNSGATASQTRYPLLSAAGGQPVRRRRFRHRDHVGGNGALRRFGNTWQVSSTSRVSALGCQLRGRADVWSSVRGSGTPVCRPLTTFVVADTEVAGQLAQRFGMTVLS